MRRVWFVMTQSSSLPGSNFPGPPDAVIYVECQLRADTIRDALDLAESSLLHDGYRVEHISSCVGYDLDDWDFDDYPTDSDLRVTCEHITETGDVEYGPFCYA